MRKLKRPALALLVLLLAVCVIISASVKSHAAGKKTVRVTSQEELVEAINNSKVGTIILRGQTCDKITIASNKKAKSKKLIVDASNAQIVNKAKFKSITINSAGKYTEAVSGNTIAIPTYCLSELELAKKKSIKKLILTDFNGFEETDMYCVIRKSAKIKNIVYKGSHGTFSLDKSTGTLSFEEDAFEWGEPAKVVISFDGSGRIVSRTEDFETENDSIYSYGYDKNGNLLEANGYVCYEEGEAASEVQSGAFKYDSKNRVIFSNVTGRYSAITTVTSYYYNSKGKLIRTASESSATDEIGIGEYVKSPETTEYTYDSKGRLSKKTVENSEASTTIAYKYNDKGYVLTEKETDSLHPDGLALTTYTYDDYGNLIKNEYLNFDGTTSTYDMTYDELGEWVETTYTDSDGEKYTYSPYTAG